MRNQLSQLLRCSKRYYSVSPRLSSPTSTTSCFISNYKFTQRAVCRNDFRRPYINAYRLLSSSPVETDKFQALIPAPHEDPIEVFRSWLTERQSHPRAPVNSASFATLSTIDHKANRPCSRVISIADINGDGKFVFTTTLTSAKSQQLMKNPNCSLVFNWAVLMKQVRINGTAKMADDMTSDQIWSNKDRAYWIWACTTKQTREIDSIEDFQKQMQHTAEQYEGIARIPRPPNWCAWFIDPEMIEFWRAHNEGLHHRHRYEKQMFGQIIKPWLYRMIEP